MDPQGCLFPESVECLKAFLCNVEKQIATAEEKAETYRREAVCLFNEACKLKHRADELRKSIAVLENQTKEESDGKQFSDY